MAYTPTADAPRVSIANASGPKHLRGFFRRAFDAMVEARRRAAEREIAAFMERRGFKLTDDAEREIDRNLTSSERL